MRFATRAIRTGQDPEPRTGSIVVPIYQTATFQFEKVGQHRGWEYTRTGNPTRQALEICLASLEEAACCRVFASGSAATDALLAFLKAGDHVVCHSNLYGGTHRILDAVYQLRGVNATYVDARDLEAVRAAITPATRMLWLETPTNPLMQLVDIAALAKLGEQRGLMVVVDNTFASPYLQQPLKLGAHVVLHSTTKYIVGHSDVVGGAVMTDDRRLDEHLALYQNTIGAIPSPFDCYMTLRGLKTLPLRMRQHCVNAQAVAEFLETHPAVARVYYPGLASHPQHALASHQMNGFGGMLSFDLVPEIEQPRDAINTLIGELKCYWFAESLGGVESLICHPSTMSHAAISQEEREAVGITEYTVRMSIGVEDTQDLLEDLRGGLDAVVATHLPARV